MSFILRTTHTHSLAKDDHSKNCTPYDRHNSHVYANTSSSLFFLLTIIIWVCYI